MLVGLYCIMKWIYRSKSKSGPLTVNIRSVSVGLMNRGPRPFVLFALSTPPGRNNKRLQVVHCAWLIALVLCVADLRAHSTACAVTPPSALLCLTSSFEFNLPHNAAFPYQPHALTLRCCAHAVGSIFIFQMKELRHCEVR